MSSPHSSSTSSDTGTTHSSGSGSIHNLNISALQNMLNNPVAPGLNSSLPDFFNPALTAGGSFCGAFGMDMPCRPSPASTPSAAHAAAFELASAAHAAAFELLGNGSSNSSNYRPSPPVANMPQQPWPVPFQQPIVGGPTTQQMQNDDAMKNLMLVLAAAASRIARPGHGAPTMTPPSLAAGGQALAPPPGGGALGPFQQAMHFPAAEETMASHRKTAMLEAENEALRQKLQRDAEKMNLVMMLFNQIQQNGGVLPGGHINPHVVSSLAASSSSDEDSKPRLSQLRYWTEGEHQRFLEAVKIYGAHDHKAIAAKIGTRTSLQVRSHSQKFFKKMETHKGTGLPSMNRKRKHLSAQSLNLVANMGGGSSKGSGSASGTDTTQQANNDTTSQGSSNEVEVDG